MGEDDEDAETDTGSTTTGDVSTGTSAETDDEEETTTYNDSNGTAVDALNDLLGLKTMYAKLDVFKGNNTEFYELLRD
ncbi:hypothetical protein KA013_01430 [Patescibacteria group bacterium]|nr:hypothetical protein [Patescibacteria group bacterium]